MEQSRLFLSCRESGVAALRQTLANVTKLSGSEVHELKLLRDKLNEILCSSATDFDDASLQFRGWLSKRKRKGNHLSRPKRRFCVLLLDGLHYFSTPFGEELGFIESSDIAEVRWVTQDKKAFVLATHDATYEMAGDVSVLLLPVVRLRPVLPICHRTTRGR